MLLKVVVGGVDFVMGMGFKLVGLIGKEKWGIMNMNGNRMMDGRWYKNWRECVGKGRVNGLDSIDVVDVWV